MQRYVASNAQNVTTTGGHNTVLTNNAPAAPNAGTGGTATVTFTATSDNTKSSVDAPIKRGIARAQMEASGAATISAASGVVMGNDLRIGAQP